MSLAGIGAGAAGLGPRQHTTPLAPRQALQASQRTASEWERQALAGLEHAARLKDLLEESAAWSAGASPASPRSDAQQRLLEESAARAALEVQVQGLSATLSQAALASGQMERGVLPVLMHVEAELQRLLARGAGVEAG